MGFWNWLKGGFKHIGDAIVAFVKSDAVKSVLATAEGKIISAVVAELSQSNLDSGAKREAALARIGAGLKAAGLEAKGSWINLALELAVNSLKHLGPQ